ncbi:Hypothetical predicted protein [Cloeon dipterum]|uniref:Uncharacterized protein n=1 Tax=Cloeon dipterum TaxID=197152 RepID=A0A8S1DEU3_9INSE|nr:Hypothetical predicted protein [Cloeon dipterum]
MEPTLLLDLAIKALVDNIDNLDKDLVKIIIVPFRQKMLKEMFEMVRNHHLQCNCRDNHLEKMWAILPFLFKSKFYTKLNFVDLPRMNCPFSTVTNPRFQEFIRCLGANTPNLRELKIYEPTSDEYSLEERELNSIIQLKNLALLKIYNVQVPLSGILDLSRECEKLDCIRASKVMIDVELSSAAFGDDFAFICIEAYDFYLGRTSLNMVRTIPTRDPKYKAYTHYVRLSLRPRKIQELFLLAQSFAEKLKDIWIDFSKLADFEEMVEFPHLPHIKYAEIDCEGESAHALRCFMKRNGQSLQELTLTYVDIKDKMTFGEIFSSCPNLQNLELFACTLVGNDAPVYAMQQLKRFQWHGLNRFFILHF